MLNRKNIPLKVLQEELKLKGIKLVLHQHKEGNIYDVTYIDYNTKTVYSGTALGRDYNINGLLERMSNWAFSSTEKPLINLSQTNKTKEVYPKISV
ncbi:hypothetical protein [Arachidicoccus soli]|uniref:Uncharacterized protein n=1 Tax=Arachidicoccus soli TaxID=2341117 RepID=A0A386HP92_9BACT|nr:hypothetical protein [Arachidicoccus soli]AYD47310.1 hypothetical protein D6B99_06610 [Arachidicoccus soli]